MLIRYYGHVGQRSGYGVAASDLCRALLRAGHQVQIRTLATPDRLDWTTYGDVLEHAYLDEKMDPSPDVVIVHTLPYDLARVYQIAGLDALNHKTKIVAYTTWEALHAPLCLRLGPFDYFWVPSEQSAFSTANGTQPGEVIPHCFDERTLEARRERRNEHGVRIDEPRIASPGVEFAFYYSGAWTTRKNPHTVLKAFAHTFTRAEPVELILHCAGGASNLREHIALWAASFGIPTDEMPRVRVLDQWMSDADLQYMHRNADCFVSASHGEAWNLPAFEAFLAARMMIVPELQGSDEYLMPAEGFVKDDAVDARPTDALRVPCHNEFPHLDVEHGDVPGAYRVQGAQGLSVKGLWQTVDEPALARAMRDVFTARKRDLTVRYDPRDLFGYAAVVKRVEKALEEL